MVLPNAVAYGVLVSVGAVVLVAFLVVFMRLDRAPERLEEDRPPMPVGWPISTAQAAPAAPAVVRPAGLRAVEPRPDGP
jgi:hypothetical protein